MDNRQAILRTLHYHDLFDFPLTFKEICTFLITDIPTSNIDIAESLAELLNKEISLVDHYYCLAGREYIIYLRKKRDIISTEKLEKASWVIRFLCCIPSVRLLGISGSLARKNAERRADIDLFVVTANNTLWITRLCILFVLQLFGKRRHRQAKIASESMCVNMLIDEHHLRLSVDRRDLYTAYELAQLRIAWQANNMQKLLYWQNQWIHLFLANYNHDVHYEQSLILFIRSISSYLFKLMEPIARGVQMKISESHKTSETMTKTLIAFHPQDYRRKVLLAFKLREKLMRQQSLWDIDKQIPILYTRKDHVVSPLSFMERFYFK